MSFTKTFTDIVDKGNGDQEVDVSSSYEPNRGEVRPGAFHEWQIHLEIKDSGGSIASPAAGTATIYGVPAGGTTAGKVSLGTIDVTGTELMQEFSGIFDTIIVSMGSLTAGYTYSAPITAWT